MLVRGPEGLMSRPRAADDFETIRTRMEELWRERLPEQPAPTTDTSVAGHRGRCGYDMSLFSTNATDCAKRFDRVGTEGNGTPAPGLQHRLLVYLIYQVEFRARTQS